MSTTCPHCKRSVSDSTHLAGQVITCPACGKSLQLEDSGVTQAPAAKEAGNLSSGCVIVICLVVLLGLMVVAGVGVLALIASRYVAMRRNAEIDSAMNKIRAAEAAVEAYRLDTGELPTDEQGLLALRHEPPDAPANKWRGPYIATETPTDPWGNLYRYERVRDANNLPSFAVVSDGPDGESGTADDIRIPK